MPSAWFIMEYNISKTSGRCLKCQCELKVGEEFVAVLRELPEDFQREDYCTSCWNADEPKAVDQAAAGSAATSVVGVWRSRLGAPQEKKKLFVDNDLLVNFFERLEEATEPLKVNFRFVLGLVLMRKKLLVYEGRTKLPDGREEWKIRLKGSERIQRVVDPRMDEEKIAQTSEQLGQILEGEL